MADKNALQFNFTDADLPDRVTVADVEANRFTEATLERHKREGLELAVRTRWIALGIIAVQFNADLGMVIIASLWGIWHIVSGLTVGTWWANRRPADEPVPQAREVKV